MKRITIDVSKGELDFMREALQTKHINLMSYLDTCEANSDLPSWDEVAKIAEDEFEKELEKVSGKKSVFTYRPKKKLAPHGYKKDGTPKAKPGRKV